MWAAAGGEPRRGSGRGEPQEAGHFWQRRRRRRLGFAGRRVLEAGGRAGAWWWWGRRRRRAVRCRVEKFIWSCGKGGSEARSRSRSRCSLSLWCGPWAGVWLPRFRLVAETRGREEQGKGLSRSAFSRRAGPGRIDTGALRSTLPRLQNWWDFARDLDGFRARFEPVSFHASQMFPSSLFAMKWI